MRTTLALVIAALLGGCGGPDPVVVALGGDVHGESPGAEALAEGSPPLAGIADALDDVDVLVVNLETPGGPGGTPADKSITFRADEVLLERLARDGVDVVNLANNHALDHGPEVLGQTVAAAERHGIAVVGAGPDEAAAWSPAVLEVAGRRVAVSGMSDVVPDGWEAGDGWGIASALDHDRAVDAVRTAAEQAQHVVVSVHWGNEFRECPSVVQTELARRLAAAGADVVAGHHPHVVQGVEERNGAVIAYSLGNLAFYAATSQTRDAALLRAELPAGGLPDHDLVPVRLDDEGLPRTAEGAAAADRIRERVRVRSPGGGTCPAAVWSGLTGRGR